MRWIKGPISPECPSLPIPRGIAVCLRHGEGDNGGGFSVGLRTGLGVWAGDTCTLSSSSAAQGRELCEVKGRK